MPKKKHAAAFPGGGNTFVPSLTKKKAYTEEEDFFLIEGVPIFDAHDGSQENLDGVNFDGKLLSQIVAQCNKRIKDTGDLVPVTAGHTSDDPSLPEPEVLGYAKDFDMGEIGKEKPRPCIYCTLKIYKTKMEKVKGLPRRSIELWPDLVIDPVVLKGADKSAIDSVALLGAQRPARDLGLLYQKKVSGKDKYRYQLPMEKEPMDPEVIKQCVEAVMSTPEFSFIRDLMKKQNMEEDETMPMEYAEDEEKPCKMEEDEEDEEKMEPAKLRMQRDQERRRYAKLETQYHTLAQEVNTLKSAERSAKRKTDLMQLEAEGFVFDMADELEYVADLEPVRYSKHLTKIKKNYKKAPVGINVKVAAIPAEGGVSVNSSDPQEVMKQAALRAAEKYGRAK